MSDRDCDYEQLIRPIEDQMIRAVWRVVRDPDEAEDAFQEALARIWKRRKIVCRHPNPHFLILRICLNSAYDALRRRKRRSLNETLTGREAYLESSCVPPAEAMARQEQHRQILQAIGQLSRNQAVAVLMRIVQNLSYEEIAEALGCSQATARTHVTRGRRHLRTQFNELMPSIGKEKSDEAR